MKKYITVAALLAAGTAFANAAELIAQWNDFSDLTSDLGSVDLTVSVGTGGASIVDGNLSVAAVSTAAARADVDLTGCGITGSTGFTLVMDVSDWRHGANSVLADMMFTGEGASGDNGMGIGRGNAYNVKWAVNNEGSANTNVTSTGSVSDGGRLVLTYDGTTGGAVLYVDGAEVSKATKRSDLSSYNFTSLVLGGMGGANVGASSFTLSKMALYSGVLSKTDITAGNVYVPEPSAFGMLAGLGALALVASRRRRK